MRILRVQDSKGDVMKKKIVAVISIIAILMFIGCSFSDFFPIPVETPSSDPATPSDDTDHEELVTQPDSGDISEYFPSGFGGVSYEEGVYTLILNEERYEYREGNAPVSLHGRNPIEFSGKDGILTLKKAGSDPLVFTFT